MTVREYLNFHGLQPLGGAIILKKLYLINPWTKLHQILHSSSACSCESTNQNWWSFATGGALGGAIKMNIFFSNTSFCLSFSKFHMLLQHHRVNICYDFHEWT